MANSKKACLQCGSCLNLEDGRAFDKPCAQLGKVITSKACSTAYVPNVKLIARNEDNERLESLAHGMRGMSANELQALAGVFLHEKKTRAAGWSFYQRVYVRYQGTADRDYMSNFLVGYVLYADREFVRVVGKSGKTFLTLPNEKVGTTLYTPDRFRPLREKMREEGKFVDSRLDKELLIASSRVGHIATMDEVVENERLAKKTNAKSGRTDDLVSIVSRISRGVLVSEREKRVKEKKKKATRSTVNEITFHG